MARKIFQKYFPNLHKVREHPSLHFLGDHLTRHNLWHLHRNSVARAFAIGIFCALLPIPFQMILAAVLAVLWTANLPLSVILVWITNPLTMPPIFLTTYHIGLWVLGREAVHIEFEWSWNILSMLLSSLSDIGLPLLVGSLVAGLLCAFVSYFAIQFYWRWYVVRIWRTRHKKRLAQALHKIVDP